MNSGATAPEWDTDDTGTTITTVRKTADETVNNSATLQNDDVLLLALAANETWYFMLTFGHVGNGAADIRVGFTIPAGATMRYGCSAARMTDLDTVNFCVSIPGSGTTQAYAGGTDQRHVTLSGVVVNGGTAGDLQFQWAQDTATVVDTKVLTNSYLEAHK